MTPTYQRIDDPIHGDCFKCCICTILDLPYDDVPNFIEFPGDEWWTKAVDLFKEHGYELGGRYLYNPNVISLESPTYGCFEKYVVPKKETLESLKLEEGINGIFLASVYSPKYQNPNEHPKDHLHSVLCDIYFNIVFDPQEEYQDIVAYPYSRIIGYNGIRGIETIRKIN